MWSPLNVWMSSLVSLVMIVNLFGCVENENILILGNLKEHLGAYWRGCMGGLFISYVGGS